MATIITSFALKTICVASALAPRGFAVTLLEARNRLGGRAGSFTDAASGQLTDTCQHVSMGCCTNLADFSRRMEIAGSFRTEPTLHFLAPDGRRYDYTSLLGPIGSLVSGAETTGTGIGGDVKTNAAGDVFGLWPDTGSRKIFVAKSTNGGVSFGSPVQIAQTFDSYDIGIPSMNSRRALIYVAAGAYKSGPVDNVYAVWTDLTGVSGCTSSANEPGSNTASTCKSRIWFSRSTNGGAAWSAPVMLNNQASLNDQFNPWLAVDEATGAVAVIYYDTVADAGRKKVDVWYQSSFTGGASWSAATKITSAQTDETSSGADSGNQFGDYNSLSGYLGVYFPSWTDRRANTAGSREEIWTAKITDTACSQTGAPAIGTADQGRDRVATAARPARWRPRQRWDSTCRRRSPGSPREPT